MTDSLQIHNCPDRRAQLPAGRKFRRLHAANDNQPVHRLKWRWITILAVIGALFGLWKTGGW